MSTRVPPFAPSGSHVTVSTTIGTSGDVLQFDGIVLTSGQNVSPNTVTPLSKARTVRVYNYGPAVVFIEFVGSQGDRTASPLTGMPLAAGATEKFTVNGATFLSLITAANTATVYATPGEGL